MVPKELPRELPILQVLDVALPLHTWFKSAAHCHCVLSLLCFWACEFILEISKVPVYLLTTRPNTHNVCCETYIVIIIPLSSILEHQSRTHSVFSCCVILTLLLHVLGACRAQQMFLYFYFFAGRGWVVVVCVGRLHAPSHLNVAFPFQHTLTKPRSRGSEQPFWLWESLN